MREQMLNDKMREDGLAHEVPYRFDLLDAAAITAMATVMAEGATTHPREGWREMVEEDILNHALGHIFSHMAGDRRVDHLAHAMCRTMMGWAVHNEKGQVRTDPFRKKEPFMGPKYGEGEYPTGADYWREQVNEAKEKQMCDSAVIVNPPVRTIYLCYPYRDNPGGRTERAKAIARDIRREYPNHIILVPHLMFQFLSEEVDRPVIMQMCKKAVALADIVIVAGRFVSDGMQEELDEAKLLKKNIIDWQSGEQL